MKPLFGPGERQPKPGKKLCRRCGLVRTVDVVCGPCLNKENVTREFNRTAPKPMTDYSRYRVFR